MPDLVRPSPFVFESLLVYFVAVAVAVIVAASRHADALCFIVVPDLVRPSLLFVFESLLVYFVAVGVSLSSLLQAVSLMLCVSSSCLISFDRLAFCV